MGSKCHPNGSHYDLTKSRRTRKSTAVNSRSLDQKGDREGGSFSIAAEGKERKTLRELLEGEIEKKQGNSLGHHFKEEEKHLALATKQGECIEGAKVGGLVGHYIEILNHLIKVKRNARVGHRKRSIPRLLT